MVWQLYGTLTQDSRAKKSKMSLIMTDEPRSSFDSVENVDNYM